MVKWRRCAIWHDGALGDLLISALAMSLIVSRVKQCILVARGEVGRFVADLLGMERFLPSDSSVVAQVFEGECPPSLRELDVLFLFSRKPDGHHVECLKEFLRENLMVISSSKEGCDMNCSLYEWQFLQVARLLGNDAGGFSSYVNELKWLSGDGGGGYYVIHPGSGGRAKCWPPEKFAALVSILSESFPSLVPKVVIGPAEEERLEDFHSLLSIDGVEVVRDCALKDLFCFLKRARFYLGNDSGVSHLAALGRTESFLLFGPTDPRIWAPPFPWVHVITPQVSNNIQEIEVGAVFTEVTKTISSGEEPS